MARAAAASLLMLLCGCLKPVAHGSCLEACSDWAIACEAGSHDEAMCNQVCKARTRGLLECSIYADDTCVHQVVYDCLTLNPLE